MSEPAKKQETEAADQRICFCHDVMRSKIVSFIEARTQAGQSTELRDVQLELYASTGCGGCEFEVRELIDAHGLKS